jgi:hypothetical protein
MCIETYIFTWNNITIRAIYQPNKWNVIAHIEVEAIDPVRTPLPITETGYLSHYHPIGSVEESGMTVVEMLTLWLSERARSKAWREFEERSRQGNLFA